MNQINEQAETSQVDAKVQLVNGKSVVDHDENSFVSEILTLKGDKLPKKIKYAFSYQAAKNAGFKVVFLKGNRKVYNSQIQALWNSAKEKRMFEDACYVVPLQPILEKYPDIEAYDIDGTPITQTSPELDSYLVVYDGQHRITVCELHSGEIDVQLELNDFNGTNPLDSIKLMNSFSKNWNCKDLRDSNVGAGYTTNKLYEESDKLQYLYGITSKLAEYILTFEREATKKKDLINGKDTSLYDDDFGNRGKGIFSAAMMNFNEAKELKKMEFLDAVVYTYKKESDKDKESFARNMKIFLGVMEEAERKKVKDLIKDKNYGQLMDEICLGYKNFCKNHNEESLAMKGTELNSLIENYVRNVNDAIKNKALKKPMKSGRTYEVIQQNAKIQKDKLLNAEKIAEKAQADVEKIKAAIRK